MKWLVLLPIFCFGQFNQYGTFPNYLTEATVVVDVTAPVINSFLATGDADWADSVYIQADVVVETGFINIGHGASGATDTSQVTSIIGGWITMADIDSTFLFSVGQDSSVNFYCLVKDASNNFSISTNLATVYDVAAPATPDSDPPNTTGTIATFFIRSNMDSIDATTVSSDSGDIAGYLIYARSSAKEVWTFLDTLVTVVDTSLTLQNKVSIDGNDSLFTKIAAYDTSSNVDPTGITDSEAPEDSSWYVKLLTYPDTWTWATFEFSVSDSISDGDSLYTLSNADSILLGDTLAFYIDSLHYDLDSTMYTRVKFDGGNWGAWFLDTLITPTAPAPPAGSWDFAESFDPTGYDSSWTEAGTPNEDYTTAPAPLEGAQSWYNATSGADAYATISMTDSTHVRFRWVSLSRQPTGGNISIFSLHTGGGSVCGTLALRNSGGAVAYSASHGGVSATFDAAVGYSDNTEYWVWMDWIPENGTSTDGILRVYFSTTTTQPASPDVVITTGDQATLAGLIIIQGGTNGFIIDSVIQNEAEIGSAAF